MNRHTDAYWHPGHMPSRQDIAREAETNEIADHMSALTMENHVGDEKMAEEDNEDQEIEPDGQNLDELNQSELTKEYKSNLSSQLEIEEQSIPSTKQPDMNWTDTAVSEEMAEFGLGTGVNEDQLDHEDNSLENLETPSSNTSLLPRPDVVIESSRRVSNSSLNLDQVPAELSFQADEHPIVNETIHETSGNDTFVHYTVNKSLENSPVKKKHGHDRQLSVFDNYDGNDEFFASIEPSQPMSPGKSNDKNKHMSIFANNDEDDSFYQSIMANKDQIPTETNVPGTGGFESISTIDESERKDSFFHDISTETDQKAQFEPVTEEKPDDIFGDEEETDDLFTKLAEQNQDAGIQQNFPSFTKETPGSKTVHEAFSFLEEDEDLLPDEIEETNKTEAAPVSGQQFMNELHQNSSEGSAQQLGYQSAQQAAQLSYQPIQQPSQPSYQAVRPVQSSQSVQSAQKTHIQPSSSQNFHSAQSNYSNTASIYQPVQNYETASTGSLPTGPTTYHNPYSAPPQAVYQPSYLDKKPQSNAFDLPTNIVPKSVVRPSASMQTIPHSNAYFSQALPGPAAPASQYAPATTPHPPPGHPGQISQSSVGPRKELIKSKSFFEELPITTRRVPARRPSAAAMVPPEIPEIGSGSYAYGRSVGSPAPIYSQAAQPPPPPAGPPPASFQNPYAPRNGADENKMLPRTRSSSIAKSAGSLSPDTSHLRSPYAPARPQIAGTPPPAAPGYAPSTAKHTNPYARKLGPAHNIQSAKPSSYTEPPQAAPLGDLPLDISRQTSMGNTAYKYQSGHSYGNMADRSHYDSVPHESFPVSSTPVDNEALLRRQFPIFHWGNGGKVAYLIPTVVSYGAAQGQCQIRACSVQKVLKSEEYALFGKFPGPLVTSKGPIKGKKKELEKWIDEKIALVQKHLSSSQSEDRLIMWQFLQILVKSDSHISKMKEEDLKKIAFLLNPRSGPKSSTLDTYQGPGHHNRTSSLESAGFIGGHGRSGTGKAYREDIRAIYSCMESGDRSGALQFSLDKNHWAHALIIASSLGPEIWNQVVADFVAAAVEPVDGGYSTGLSFMYQICSGAGERAVQAIYPPKTMSANFAQDDAHYTSQVVQALADWKNYLSFMLVNQSPNINEAILGLGRMLLQHGYVEAGHICVILSGVPSFGSPEETGITLVGSDGRWTLSATGRDEDSILLSEIYEFILLNNAPTVITPSPHLVLYKLQHAILLADYGFMQAADKQVESVSALVKGNTKAKFAPDMLAQLENTHKWITVESGSNTSGWFSSKKLDKTIIQSFNKFVAGDDNGQAASDGGTGDDSVFKRIASTPGPQMPSLSLETSPYNGSAPHSTTSNEAPQLNRAQSMGVLSQMARPSVGHQSSYFGSSETSTSYGYDPMNGATGTLPPDTPGSNSSNGGPNNSRPVTPQTNNLYNSPSPSAANLSRPASSQQFGSQINARQFGKKSAYGNATYADSTSSLNGMSSDSVSSSNPYAPTAKPRLTRTQSASNPYAPLPGQQSTFPAAHSSDNLLSKAQPSHTYIYGNTTTQSQDNRADSESPQRSNEPSIEEYEGQNGMSDEYMYGESADTYGAIPENRKEAEYEDDIEGGSYMAEAQSSMAKTNYAPISSYSSFDASATTIPEEEEEAEDLGIANKKPALKKETSDDKKDDTEGKEAKGWFGWLRKGPQDEKPKAVRAKLGEQSAFYYDKDLKRWVNKNTPLEEQKPAAPPPPKKATTPIPKPGTPVSSTPLGTGQPSRVSSGPPAPGSLPGSGKVSPVVKSTGAGGLDELLAAPPTSSRRGNRKNARNRYVDIMADK